MSAEHTPTERPELASEGSRPHMPLTAMSFTIASIHSDERAATVTSLVECRLAFYAAHGIKPSRLLSDNAFVYRKNRSLHELLTREEIRHKFIRPRRPQTNGKVERFQQT